MKLIRLALIGIASLCFYGCSTGGIATSTEAPVASSSQLTEYEIGIGDQLNINVWRNPELTLSVPVRPDGMISMPLVGDIKAAGNSAQELNTLLMNALVNFIRNPQVTVIVTDAASTDFQRRVRVTGAVDAPLSIPHRAGMTVLDMVLEAGGLTDFAQPNKTVLYRKTDSGVQAYAIRLGDILNKGRLETNYQLAPSDIITIPERVF